MADKVAVICSNVKTYKSLDLSTNCPKRQAGNPCTYCYVEAARKNGYNAKHVHDRILYNGDILRLKQDTIEKLNAAGGLRVFSFSDYMPWMYEDMIRVVEDAKFMGLKLKAITKVPEFVELFHEYFNVIHISVDNVGCGVSWETAKALKQKYPNVLIRAAIMADEDINALEEFCDILTFNHAINVYKLYSKKELKKYFAKYPDKVCCQTGKCNTCPIQCGELKIEVNKLLQEVYA